jgi:3-hydroxyisobutyrate dehydrogenase/glyoxylate/succinic semialdehyde reductase
MKTGFIGLGIMGSRMAANLIKKGYNLIVFNRTAEKSQSLKEIGAEVANSPEEIAKQTDIIFTMLSTPDAVNEVGLGKNGLLKIMKENSIWIDCSTVNPSFTKEMASEAKKHKIRFIDAPVAGSAIPAETGQLIFYVGGKEKDVEEIRPYFNAMGKAVFYMGENGMGSAMKIVNNILLGASMLSFSEALFLGEKLGIAKETLLNILPGGPVTAPYITSKKSKFANDDFSTEFPL